MNTSANRDSVLRIILISALLSVGLSLALSLALDANDTFLQSRSGAWVPALLSMQRVGFKAVARYFPCQKEGFDAGCERYKSLSLFLAVNAATYLPFMLCGVYVFASGRFVRKHARAVNRTAFIAGIFAAPIGLLVSLASLTPEIDSDSAHQNWSERIVSVPFLCLSLLLVFLSHSSLERGKRP